MLRKLLKYDLEWIYKVIVVFYALSFIFSITGRMFSIVENSFICSVIASILFGAAISMIISGLINCIMRSWVRFIKNMYKDEAYLTHTLPINKKTIYLSKVLSSVITIFITIFVGVACLFICYYSKENIDILKSLLEVAATTYDTTVAKLLILISFVFFLEIIYIVLIGYVGIILGHKSNKNKMLRSIIISFVLYSIMQIITLFIVVIYGFFNQDIMNLINTTEMISIDSIKSIMYVAIGIYTAFSLVLYVFGKKELEKGVNID